MEGGIPVVLAIVWLVNFGISFWNARVTGQIWVESKQAGGFIRVLAWCGAIMSASGFIWCYAVIEAFVGRAFAPEYVTPAVFEGVLSLMYLIIIFPVLGTGLVIWATSLYEAWVRRDMASVGVAAWNTFAQAHNMYSAARGIPEAMRSTRNVFSGKGRDWKIDEGTAKGGAALVVVLLVLAAVVLGIVTTAAIIMKYAGTRPLTDGKQLSHA